MSDITTLISFCNLLVTVAKGRPGYSYRAAPCSSASSFRPSRSRRWQHSTSRRTPASGGELRALEPPSPAPSPLQRQHGGAPAGLAGHGGLRAPVAMYMRYIRCAVERFCARHRATSNLRRCGLFDSMMPSDGCVPSEERRLPPGECADCAAAPDRARNTYAFFSL